MKKTEEGIVPVQPLMNHVIELRQRFIKCLLAFFVVSIVAYIFSENVFYFLLTPLMKVMAAKDNHHHQLIFTSVPEAFLTYIKVSVFCGFFFSLPLVLVQVWRFISPGLFSLERKIFRFFMMGIPLLFLFGSLFAYYVVFPKAYEFFLSFEKMDNAYNIPLVLEPRINEYLSFVMHLILAFGICFQLPVLVFLMYQFKFLTLKGLVQKWRFWVLAMVLVSAVVTPPDLLSMLSLLLPLVGLYGVSIIILMYIDRKKGLNNA